MGSKSTAMVVQSSMTGMQQQQQMMFGCLMKLLCNQQGTQPRQDPEDLLSNLQFGGASKRSAELLRKLAEDGDELELPTQRKKSKLMDSVLQRQRTFDDCSGLSPLLNTTGTFNDSSGLLEEPETRGQASTKPEARGRATIHNNEAAAVSAHGETASESGVQKSQAIPEAVELQAEPSLKDEDAVGTDAKRKADTLLDAIIQRD